MTGYQLKKQMDQSTQFFWHAALSQIYPTLKRMEEQGLLTGNVLSIKGTLLFHSHHPARSEVWQDIGSGLLDAEGAFTEGKFDAVGSMLLMEQFPQIFQYPQPGEHTGANPELDMIMMGMPLAFNAKAAASLEASLLWGAFFSPVIQYKRHCSFRRHR
jgi:hypothetical protein